MKVNLGSWNHIFAVPASVVDNHIIKCGSAQLKVLLYLLRYPGRDVSVDEISEKLSLSPADVNDSLNYWISENIIDDSQQNNNEKHSNVDVNNFDCWDLNVEKREAVSATEEAKTEKFELSKLLSASSGLKLLNEVEQVDKHGIGTKRKNVEPVAVAPRLTLKEALERIDHNSDLKFLIEEAPKILKRNITSTDTIVIISFMDWTGLDIDLALMVMNYCASINRCSARQIEQEAYRWLNSGIDTHEKAEEFIRQNLELRSLQQEVACAFHKSELTEREKTFVKKWSQDYNYDIKMMKLAYERALMRKGEKDFSYINGILFSWYKKGVKQPAEVDDENKVNLIKTAVNKKQSKKAEGFFKLENLTSFSLNDFKAKVKN